MRGMRNRIAHRYFDINLDIVWDTVRDPFPQLAATRSMALPKGDECSGGGANANVATLSLALSQGLYAGTGEHLEVVLAGARDLYAQEVAGLRAFRTLHAHDAADLRRIGLAASDGGGAIGLVHEHLERPADLASELGAADLGLRRHEPRATLFLHLLGRCREGC